MSDVAFAAAVDRLLWITPSGDARDNDANLRALRWSLEEGAAALAALKDLTDALYSTRAWLEHPEVAVPLLEALRVVKEQSAE